MNRIISRVRKPVKRLGAETYLLITLLSFAASVALTRTFLELTGYPQLGGGGLHIAHVLWGGLLLFAAALLPLILANRWTYSLSAVLAGLGMGLFIDEVGKFITQTNDYFYPPAAPIIYAVFLVTVMLYLRLRRQPPLPARDALYHALEALQEVLDHDLDPQEHTALVERLENIAAQQDNPELSRLAGILQEYLKHPEILIAPEIPGFWKRIQDKLEAFEKRYIRPLWLRAVLIGGMSGLGVVSLLNLLDFAAARRLPGILFTSQSGVYWYVARLGLEMLVSVLLLTAAIVILLGRVRQGLSLSYYGLLLSLTMVNLLVFYFDQFSAVVSATFQFILLLLVLYYRRKYIISPGGTL